MLQYLLTWVSKSLDLHEVLIEQVPYIVPMRDIIEGKVCKFISSDDSNMLNILGSLFGWDIQKYESSNGWMHVI